MLNVHCGEIILNTRVNESRKKKISGYNLSFRLTAYSTLYTRSVGSVASMSNILSRLMFCVKHEELV